MYSIYRKFNSIVMRYNENKWRFSFKGKFIDKKYVEIKEPIFILGTQGGGLSIISRMIRRSPTPIATFSGNNRLWTSSDELQNGLAKRIPIRFRLKHHPVFATDPYRGNWRYATNEYFNRFYSNENDYDETEAQEFREIIKELLAIHGQKGKAYRFLDKSQTFTLKTRLLEAFLEDSPPKFLLIVRNPFAMIHRAAMLPQYNEKSLEERYRLAAEHWSNSIRTALEDGKYLTNFKVVRFEDVLEKPYAMIQDISHFLNIQYNEDMVPAQHQKFPLGGSWKEKWYPINTRVNDRYLDQISSTGVSIVDEYCSDLIEKFGYIAP